MPTYLDDNGNPISAAPKKTYLDPNTGEPMAANASVDLSNSQGQGTYNMWDTQGQIHPVPYGQVQQAAQQGFKFDTNPNKAGLTPSQQFQKDHNHATTGPGNEAAFAQSDQNAPLGMQAVSGVVKGMGTMAKPALDVVGRLTGVPQQSIDSSMSANTPTEMAGKVAMIGAAAAPSAIVAPVATAGAAVGGTLGAGAGEVIGNVAGMKPENTALLSDALGIAGGIGGGMGANRAVPSVRSYLRPTPSPSIVPRTEMAARNLASVILPDIKDATGFIRAAQSEVPNVIDFAKRTNNPLNTQLEFSKAAQGYADELVAAKKQIMEPVQNQLVRTTGTGFGSRMNEGQDTYATLGEIDKRVVALNKQLEAPALNTGDTRRMLADTEDLQAEVRKLTNLRTQTLSQSSGLPPEQVEDLLQRAPKAFDLAQDTNAAVTKRMQQSGQADIKPIKTTELPSRALNFVRGSTVNVADRNFQRAIANFPGESRPIPTPQAPAPAPGGNMDALLQAAKQKRMNDLLRLQRMQQ